MRHRFAVQEFVHGGWVYIASFARLNDALDFVGLLKLSGRIVKSVANKGE